MTSYSNTGNFSSTSTERYSLTVYVETTPVSGGMRLDVSADAYLFNPTGITPAFSSNGSRTYSVPNGRISSTSGSLLTSGSASWSYDFGANYTQSVWGGFTRFIASGSGNTGSVTITASGSGSSFLQNASVTVSNISLLNSYSISYNANGGSGSVGNTTTSTTNDSATLTVASGSGLSRSGYNFVGWNTSSNGTGTSYSAGSSLSLSYSSPSITLYAQWELAIPAPSFTDGINLSLVRVGENWSDSVSASNTYAALSQSGTSYQAITLLSGQSLSVIGNTAYINGTIGTTTSGSYTLRVRAYGPGGSTDTTASVTVRQALPSWTDTTLSSATKGSYYSDTFSASNATNWTVSGIPSGLSGSGTNSTTVTISGTPSVYGNYTLTAIPYNSDGDAGSTQYISLSISDSAISWSDQILTSSTVVQGEAYSDSVLATGSTAITYSLASGSLPAGVTLNSSTGAITGTPEAGTENLTYNFTIQASNGDGSSVITTSTLSITVEAAGGYVKVRSNGTWVDGTVYRRQSGIWVESVVKVRDNGTWTDSFSS